MKTIIQALIVSVYSFIIATTAYANGHGNEHHERFACDDVIVTLGILTIVSLISTFLAGYFMPKHRKLLFPWHKRLGILTVILALSHALMVLFFD